MSPIEIFIDRKRVAESSSGPCELRLPDPPGGNVNWFGDGAGTGKIIVGEKKQKCTIPEIIRASGWKKYL